MITSRYRRLYGAVIAALSLLAVAVLCFLLPANSVLLGALSLLAYLSLLILITKEFSLIGSLFVFSLPGLLLWFPFLQLITSKSPWSFVALLIVLGWLSYRRGKEISAGIFFGAGSVLQPAAVMLLIWLIFRRSWRAATGFALAACAVLVSFVLIPELRNLHDLRLYENPELLQTWGALPGNISLFALIMSVFQAGESAPAFDAPWLGGFVFAALFALLVRGMLSVMKSMRSSRELDYGFALLLLAIPLLAPLVSSAVFIVTFVPIGLLLSRPMLKSDRICILVALILMSLSPEDLVSLSSGAQAQWWNFCISKLSILALPLLSWRLMLQERR